MVTQLVDWLGTVDGEKWAQDVGFRILPNGTQTLSFVKLRADTRIKLVGVLDRSQLIDAYDEWKDVLEQLNRNATNTTTKAVQVLGTANSAIFADMQNKWIQITMHDVYAVMSTWGLVSGLVVALLVLLIVTRSVSIACIAVGCLLQVIAGVLASMLWAGWALGIIESLCLILVSGLSVDYVLHVACAFAQSTATGRIARTEAALERMGSPLFAGTTTTLVSALSLCLCTFTVLVKIGVFMAFTSVWSYISAQTLLPALLGTYGPNQRRKFVSPTV